MAGSAPIQTAADLPPSAAVITGRGWHVPDDILTNEDIAGCLDDELLRTFVTSNKWCLEYLEGKTDLSRAELERAFVHYVTERIGIRTRHVIDRQAIIDGKPSQRQVFASDLGAKACQMALDDAGIDAKDVDLIVCGTASPDQVFPTTGINIQGLIGAENAHAFDVLAACSAFAYALHSARAMVEAGMHRRVLAISAEYFTAAVNYADPNNSFFWGDAAAGVLVERADLVGDREGFHIKDSECWSIPSPAIRIGLGGTKPYLAGATRHDDRDPGKIELGGPDDPYFYQDGRKVFRDVVPTVVARTAEFIKRNELDVDDIRRFWFHQPSNLFLGSVVKRLLKGNNADRVARTLGDYGNTSSAGSPLCLAKDDITRPGDWGVVSVFGAGYTIGTALLRHLARPGS